MVENSPAAWQLAAAPAKDIRRTHILRAQERDLAQKMDELSAPHPVLEVLLGTLALIVIIFVHGAGIRAINRSFSRSWVQVNEMTPYWRLNLLLAFTIAALSALHFSETLLWAIPIYAMQLVPSMRDSYYYVLESYTTLGEGNVSLPDHWRLIGPIIAMSGLFTFGWTGSVLVNIMTEFGKLDRTRARSGMGESMIRNGAPQFSGKIMRRQEEEEEAR